MKKTEFAVAMLMTQCPLVTALLMTPKKEGPVYTVLVFFCLSSLLCMVVMDRVYVRNRVLIWIGRTWLALTGLLTLGPMFYGAFFSALFHEELSFAKWFIVSLPAYQFVQTLICLEVLQQMVPVNPELKK